MMHTARTNSHHIPERDGYTEANKANRQTAAYPVYSGHVYLPHNIHESPRALDYNSIPPCGSAQLDALHLPWALSFSLVTA